MVVQHNMQAINANRQLKVVTGAQDKSTEKLSSDYRINRAADDAAGLYKWSRWNKCPHRTGWCLYGFHTCHLYFRTGETG